jgi:DNA-binding response OmpR family regulator
MSKKKILIVDDDPDVQRGLSIRLRASGFDTVIASDGYSGTKLAQEEKPDLVLLDIGLPAGDGFVVMERLSMTFIPIIVLSARDPETNKERALQAGAVAYFQKPADNDELLAAIQKAIKGADAPTQGEK